MLGEYSRLFCVAWDREVDLALCVCSQMFAVVVLALNFLRPAESEVDQRRSS